MENVINLSEVSYQYSGAKELNLRDINLSVESGKFIAILGPTGAGKTTICLCLNGLIPQFMGGRLTGDLKVLGKNPSQVPVQNMARHVGLVLQDPESQILGNSVEEDTAFGPKNLGLPLEEVKLRVSNALKLVGLGGYEKRNSRQLSGGEKQRVAIAGILAMETEIVVLDEPTSELDPAGRRSIYTVIDDIRHVNNLTTLVVEHNTEEILERADEVIVINNGKILWRGLPRALFRNIDLLCQYGIRPLPISMFGWGLYQRGWIEAHEVPLDIPEAKKLLQQFNLVHNQEFLSKEKVHRSFQDPIIEVTKLGFSYDNGVEALKSVDVTIRKGEFIAIIGSNGSGKTTLTKHFNGLLKPTSGEVNVDGKNTKQFDVVELSQIVGYVFQNPDHQIFSSTVEKELQYGLQNMGIPFADIRTRISEVLKLTGLEQYQNEHPLSLGKGIRQLIALASVLVLKTKVLVIDEPTTGLDWNGIKRVMELISQLHIAGTTIVMISHDIDLVAQYADRVIVVDKGQILVDGTTREVLSNFEILEKADIIPPQILRLAKEVGLEAPLLNEKELLEIVQLK